MKKSIIVLFMCLIGIDAMYAMKSTGLRHRSKSTVRPTDTYARISKESLLSGWSTEQVSRPSDDTVAKKDTSILEESLLSDDSVAQVCRQSDDTVVKIDTAILKVPQTRSLLNRIFSNRRMLLGIGISGVALLLCIHYVLSGQIADAQGMVPLFQEVAECLLHNKICAYLWNDFGSHADPTTSWGHFKSLAECVKDLKATFHLK